MIPAPDPIATNLILGASILLAALIWNATVIWYSITAKWWKGEYGVNTWAISFIIAVALDRLAILVLAPGLLPKPESDWVGIFTYVVLAIFGAHRLYLLEKAQRDGRRKQPQPELHPPCKESRSFLHRATKD